MHHWKHGWIPADAYATMVEKRKTTSVEPKLAKMQTSKVSTKPIVAAWTPPRGTSMHKTRVFKSNGLTPGLVSDKSRKNAPSMISSLKENGGFTYDPKKGGLLEVGKHKGFAIAVPGTEEIIGSSDISREDFAKGVAAVVTKHHAKIAKGAVIGGWYSEERKQYMVELTEIHPPDDRAGAIRKGKARNQEAIFDLSTGETIPTGGTGG